MHSPLQLPEARDPLCIRSWIPFAINKDDRFLGKQSAGDPTSIRSVPLPFKRCRLPTAPTNNSKVEGSGYPNGFPGKERPRTLVTP